MLTTRLHRLHQPDQDDDDRQHHFGHEMPDAFERRRRVRRTFQGRVSCDKFDRGYENYTNLLRDGYKIRIFLNDVEQAHCLIADPDEGWIMNCVLIDYPAAEEHQWDAVVTRISLSLAN